MARAITLMLCLAAACSAPEGSGGDDPTQGADAGVEADAGLPAACYGVSPKQLPVQPITSGVDAPTAFEMTPGQQLAIGALLEFDGRSWYPICTATLIAPNVVLTAAHCVVERRGNVDPADVRFGIGTDMRTPVATFDVVAVTSNPSYDGEAASHDFAVLRLAASVLDTQPTVVPLAPNEEALSSTIIGSTVQNVGFGMTNPIDSDNTRKWWTTEELVLVNSWDLVVDGHGVSAVCFGDSGGPVLRRFEDGSVRIIGVLSWGDQSCRDRDHFGRVDRNMAWIRQQSPEGETVDGCAGFTVEGTCADTIATRCVDGKTVRWNCAASNAECGRTKEGLATCIEDHCDGLDFNGRCEGNTAIWCENGERRFFDCGACEQRCGWVGAGLGRFCLPKF